jgi:hypothetical protein
VLIAKLAGTAKYKTSKACGVKRVGVQYLAEHWGLKCRCLAHQRQVSFKLKVNALRLCIHTRPHGGAPFNQAATWMSAQRQVMSGLPLKCRT